MPLPPTTSQDPGDGAAVPLSDQHFQAIRDAKTRRKKIDVAIGVATFNIWSIGLFAALSGMILLFSFTVIGLVISAGLGIVAYQEFKGRAMLRQLDAQGARLLGFNQLALGGLIVGYCLWSLVAALVGPGAYAEVIEQNPELAGMLGDTGELFRLATVIVYGMAIVLTVPYQGLVAWYYFSRAKHVTQYVSQTPQWVTQMQRAAA